MEMNSKSKPTNNIAIAYTRVSTEEQEKKGLSSDHQKELIKRYVEEYNYSIEKSFSTEEERSLNKIYLDEDMIFDETSPASTIYTNNIDSDLKENLKSRPRLQKILELAQQKRFGHLIVQSRDRLTRDFEQFIALKYLFDKNNIKIHYARPGENLQIEDSKINRFVDNILACVAELEADVISVRVKSGGTRCIKNGYWAGGKPPLGYNIQHIPISGKSKQLAKLDMSIYESNLVIRIFRLYGLGYGYREISGIMNDEYPHTKWTKGKIEGIIKNETYTGYTTWDRRGGRRHPGKHETIVQSDYNEDLKIVDKVYWDSISKLRTYKSEIKDPKYYDTPYILKNKIVCGRCGQKLNTKNYGKDKNGENVYVYRCPRCKNSDNSYKVIFKRDTIEPIVICKIKNSFKFLDIDNLWNTYNCEKEKRESEISTHLDELDSKIKTVIILRENIKLMIKNLGNPPNKKELIERLLHQDMLLLKVKIQYENEKLRLQNSFNRRFILDKSEYQNTLERFMQDIDSLDMRRKRIFIDLVIDNITIPSPEEDIPLDENWISNNLIIVVNPSPIIR
jgi:site-specific DNA recombinase